MALLKSREVKTVVAFSMKDVERQACALLAKARDDAKKILAEARDEAHKLHEHARRDGFDEGRREGIAIGKEDGREFALAESRKHLNELCQSLTTAMSEIEQSRRKLEEEAVREVIDLAIAIARRVTKSASELDPSVLFENVREAMKLVSHAADVRIAIAPAQHELLEQSLTKIAAEFPKLSHVEIVADDTVAAGGCRIITQRGEIDADLNTQLNRIAAELGSGSSRVRSDTDV